MQNNFICKQIQFKNLCNIIVLMEGYEACNCIAFTRFRSFQLRRTLTLIFKKKDDYKKLSLIFSLYSQNQPKNKKNAQTSLNRSLGMSYP